jgi:hypothetical protein
MVLRGNQIKPDESLPDAKRHLDESKVELQRALTNTTNKPNASFLKSLQDRVNLDSNALEKTIKQLLCGGIAGAIARSTVAPVDRVKILMQTAYVQKKTHLYPTMLATAKEIIKSDGIIGLWRGNLTNCVRVVPHTAVQFVAYDKFKIMLIGSSDGKLTIPQRLLCGSISGICAASVTQPLDVVRIRLQTDPDCKGSVRLAVRQMMAEPGGWINFYKG